jgi:hypothetical protein
MYVIQVTPSNKNFPKHIWKEGGEFFTKLGAERHAKQMRRMKAFNNKRRKFYDKVEVVPNPLILN